MYGVSHLKIGVLQGINETLRQGAQFAWMYLAVTQVRLGTLKPTSGLGGTEFPKSHGGGPMTYCLRSNNEGSASLQSHIWVLEVVRAKANFVSPVNNKSLGPWLTNHFVRSQAIYIVRLKPVPPSSMHLKGPFPGLRHT